MAEAGAVPSGKRADPIRDARIRVSCPCWCGASSRDLGPGLSGAVEELNSG